MNRINRSLNHHHQAPYYYFRSGSFKDWNTLALGGIHKAVTSKDMELEELLEWEDWWDEVEKVRDSAAEVLGDIGEARATKAGVIEKLLRASTSWDWNVRRTAIDPLRRMLASAASKPQVVERLATRLDTRNHPFDYSNWKDYFMRVDWDHWNWGESEVLPLVSDLVPLLDRKAMVVFEKALSNVRPENVMPLAKQLANDGFRFRYKRARLQRYWLLFPAIIRPTRFVWSVDRIEQLGKCVE